MPTAIKKINDSKKFLFSILFNNCFLEFILFYLGWVYILDFIDDMIIKM